MTSSSEIMGGSTSADPPPYPGGTALSRIKAYDTVSPDGHRSGTPHVHLACTECYVVLAGRGKVQTLSASGFREMELAPGKVVWFEPGVVHRDINEDGQLEFLVIMGNAGLPEAGDHVLTFPGDVLRDEPTYRRAASLDDLQDAGALSMEQRARQRRDLAVNGFLRLREAVEQHGPGALDDFYRSAQALVAPQLEAWRELWQERLRPVAERTGDHLDALQQGDHGHLVRARIGTADGQGVPPRFGMCGMLTPLPAAQQRGGP